MYLIIYTRLNYTIQWCTNFGSNLMLSARTEMLDPKWKSENKWQIRLNLTWEIKIYSLINNRAYIRLRERERERRGGERERTLKIKISQILFIFLIYLFMHIHGLKICRKCYVDLFESMPKKFVHPWHKIHPARLLIQPTLYTSVYTTFLSHFLRQRRCPQSHVRQKSDFDPWRRRLVIVLTAIRALRWRVWIHNVTWFSSM